LVVAAIIVTAAGMATMWPTRITRRNFDGIREGMTREEVAATLGPPSLTRPDLDRLDMDYFDIDAMTAAWHAGANPAELEDPTCIRYWLGSAGIVAVGFRDDRAVEKGLVPRAGPLLRLRRQWHRWFP
jgi:hypothetical protein